MGNSMMQLLPVRVMAWIRHACAKETKQMITFLPFILLLTYGALCKRLLILLPHRKHLSFKNWLQDTPFITEIVLLWVSLMQKSKLYWIRMASKYLVILLISPVQLIKLLWVTVYSTSTTKIRILLLLLVLDTVKMEQTGTLTHLEWLFNHQKSRSQ